MRYLQLLLLTALLLGCKEAPNNEVSTSDEPPALMEGQALPVPTVEAMPPIPENKVAMEFFSASETPSRWFKSSLHYLNQTNTLPENRDHQLLPSWLRIGERSLASVMAELKELTPIVYISEEATPDPRDTLRVATLRENPDIAISNPTVLPNSPQELALYSRNFIELDRLDREEPIEAMGGFDWTHWAVAYLHNRPIIYEYRTKMLGVMGRIRLEFHGDYLNTLIFIPDTYQRLDLSQQGLPVLANFDEAKTLRDLFTTYDVTGTLKIQRSLSNLLTIHYHQDILWHGIPLTVNYNTASDSFDHPTIEEARITSATIFNFDDTSEDQFLALLKEKTPLTDTQKAWIYAFYTDAFAQDAYYDQEFVSKFFTIIDDRYVVFHQGFGMTREHILVVRKDDFNFGGGILHNFQ